MAPSTAAPRCPVSPPGCHSLWSHNWRGKYQPGLRSHRSTSPRLPTQGSLWTAPPPGRPSAGWARRPQLHRSRTRPSRTPARRDPDRALRWCHSSVSASEKRLFLLIPPRWTRTPWDSIYPAKRVWRHPLTRIDAIHRGNLDHCRRLHLTRLAGGLGAPCVCAHAPTARRQLKLHINSAASSAFRLPLTRLQFAFFMHNLSPIVAAKSSNAAVFILSQLCRHAWWPRLPIGPETRQ